jgi:phosphate-selective porin OprO and OprP
MQRSPRRRFVLSLIVILALVAPVPAGAQGQASVLEEILEILRKGGQITEEQKKSLLERAEREATERAKAQAPPAPATPAPATAGATTGAKVPFVAGVENLKPFLASPDGDFRIELGGRIQLDYDAVDDDARALNGAELADRFLVRRARLDVSGRAFRWIDFKVEADFTEGVSLKDAYLDFRFLPEVRLRGGQFKVPFSHEELTSSRFIDFVERSIINELAPMRDVGVMLHGELFGGVLGYNLGVFNGSGEDTADNNDGKDVAGRLVLAPFAQLDNRWLKGLYLAGNGTWGDQDGGSSAQGRTTARTGTRFTYFAAQPTSGNRTRFGGDFVWLLGPASLKFEYAQQRNERDNLGPGATDLDDVVARGWYASVTWIVTGEDKPLNGPVEPRSPFSPFVSKIGPGAWELAVRYARLKFESDSPLDFFDGNINNGITGGGTTAENGVDALTAGVNWYLNARVRAMVNWTRYWYDNRLGTPTSCTVPVCNASNLRRGDDTSNEVLTRLQIWF